MAKQALDYFGEVLMQQVRDAAIAHWKMVVDGKMKDESSKQIFAKIKQAKLDKEVLSEIISKTVDTCLHNFLWMLEQEEENVIVSVSHEDITVSNVAEESDGLAGELYGNNGWIKRFSKVK